MSSPYSSVVVTLTNGSELRAERAEAGDLVLLDIRGITARGEEQHAPFSSADIPTEATEEDLPRHIHQMPDGRWLDSHTGRFISPQYIEQRYRVQVSSEPMRNKILTNNTWLAELVPAEIPILIDTKRLDASYYSPPMRSAEVGVGIGARNAALARSGAAGRIGEYIEQVRQQITEARRESLQKSLSRALLPGVSPGPGILSARGPPSPS